MAFDKTPNDAQPEQRVGADRIDVCRRNVLSEGPSSPTLIELPMNQIVSTMMAVSQCRVIETQPYPVLVSCVRIQSR